MAINVSMMAVDCSFGLVAAPIYVHGSGMNVNDMVLNYDGTDVGYTVIQQSSYLIMVGQISIGFHAGIWGVAFRPNVTYPNDYFRFGLICPLKNLAGIYCINPAKVAWHDVYNGNEEHPIPNPTIRTALIGE